MSNENQNDEMPNPIDAAGEYVLDTLSIDERTAFEAALKSDRTLLVKVEEWQHLLAPVLQSAPDVAPSETVWRRLEGTLDQRLAEQEQAGNDVEDSSTVVSFDKFRQSRNRWRGFGVGLMSLAAGLTAFVFVDGTLLQPPSIVPDRLAVLTQPSSGIQFVATVDPARQGVHIRPLLAGDVNPFADGPLVLWVELEGKTVRLGDVTAAKWQWLDYSKLLETEAFTNSTLILAKPQPGAPDIMGDVVFKGRVSSKAK